MGNISQQELDEVIQICFRRYDYEDRGLISGSDILSFTTNLCHRLRLNVSPSTIEERVLGATMSATEWDLSSASSWFLDTFRSSAEQLPADHVPVDVSDECSEQPETCQMGQTDATTLLSDPSINAPGYLRISVVGFNISTQHTPTVQDGAEILSCGVEDGPDSEVRPFSELDVAKPTTLAGDGNDQSSQSLARGAFMQTFNDLNIQMCDGFSHWDADSRNEYAKMCEENELAAVTVVNLGGFQAEITIGDEKLGTSKAIVNDDDEWSLYWEKTLVFPMDGLGSLLDQTMHIAITGPNLNFNNLPGELDRINFASCSFNLQHVKCGMMVPLNIKDDFGINGGCLGLRVGYFPEIACSAAETRFLPRVQDAILMVWELCHAVNPRTQASSLPYIAATQVACRILGIDCNSAMGMRTLRRMGAKDNKSGIAAAIRSAARQGSESPDEQRRDGSAFLEVLGKETTFSEPHCLTCDQIAEASHLYDRLLKLQPPTAHRVNLDRASQYIRFAGVGPKKQRMEWRLADHLLHSLSDSVDDLSILEGVSKQVFVCVALEAGPGKKWHEEVENAVLPAPNDASKDAEICLGGRCLWTRRVEANAHLASTDSTFSVTSRRVHRISQSQHDNMNSACRCACIRAFVFGAVFTAAFFFLSGYLELLFDASNPNIASVHEAPDNEIQYWLVMISLALLFSIAEIACLYFDIIDTGVKLAYMAGVNLQDPTIGSSDFVASSVIQAGFELNYPTHNVHTIDPLKESNRLLVVLTEVCYKGKSFIITLVTKLVIKRLVARVTVKLFIPMLDVLIVAILNYMVAMANLRQMRLGLILPSPMCYMFNELLGNVPMSLQCRQQVLRALGTSILHHQELNPASQCLLENAWLVCGGSSINDAELDNTRLFLQTLKQQCEYERQMAVIVLGLGIITDGSFDGGSVCQAGEQAMMTEALEACNVEQIPERLNLLRKFTYSLSQGQYLAVSELVHIMFGQLSHEDVIESRNWGPTVTQCRMCCAT